MTDQQVSHSRPGRVSGQMHVVQNGQFSHRVLSLDKRERLCYPLAHDSALQASLTPCHRPQLIHRHISLSLPDVIGSRPAAHSLFRARLRSEGALPLLPSPFPHPSSVHLFCQTKPFFTLVQSQMYTFPPTPSRLVISTAPPRTRPPHAYLRAALTILNNLLLISRLGQQGDLWYH